MQTKLSHANQTKQRTSPCGQLRGKLCGKLCEQLSRKTAWNTVWKTAWKIAWMFHALYFLNKKNHNVFRNMFHCVFHDSFHGGAWACFRCDGGALLSSGGCDQVRRLFRKSQMLMLCWPSVRGLKQEELQAFKNSGAAAAHRRLIFLACFFAVCLFFAFFFSC